MKRENLNRALANAESWTETALLYQIALREPFTFLVEAAKWAAVAWVVWWWFA